MLPYSRGELGLFTIVGDQSNAGCEESDGETILDARNSSDGWVESSGVGGDYADSL
jgi:hypothetical protein